MGIVVKEIETVIVTENLLHWSPQAGIVTGAVLERYRLGLWLEL